MSSQPTGTIDMAPGAPVLRGQFTVDDGKQVDRSTMARHSASASLR